MTDQRRKSAAPVVVLIRGAGDLGSGVAFRLRRCGWPVIMTELALPLCVRRAVCFAEAVYEGETVVEGLRARRVAALTEAWQALADGVIPIFAPPPPALWTELHPTVVVDAIMAKRNLATQRDEAPLVVGLGPGFRAGQDCHAVIETQRGHTLGRVYWQGQALPDTGVPGPLVGVEGVAAAGRVLRAQADGFVTPAHAIGDRVQAGETLGWISREPGLREGAVVQAPFGGVLRGLIHPLRPVGVGDKIGDLDPRGAVDHCFTISDKSLAVAGGVLEAILSHAASS